LKSLSLIHDMIIVIIIHISTHRGKQLANLLNCSCCVCSSTN